MGDCGALFLGYTVAAISLMGFKGSTFITLGFPMLLLAVPIIDTLSAMVRRFLGGKKFTDADKGHFHHVLMKRFGHRNTVLIIYAITIAFGVSAYIYIMNKTVGLALVALLFLALEIFIEKTHMISENYHPLVSIYEMIFKRKQKEKE
jgi:UDP-GlcNAc:undecaprenyl-phosphate GlcNAc-1-phosphate transferase